MRPDIPEVHLELGEVYAGAFQWAKAEEEFRAQVKLQPGNAEAAYRLGAALLEQGKAHEARVELMRADKLLPDMPETIYSLGKAASLEGDAASAEKEWTKLLAIEKESPLAAQAHFGLAGLYRKQRKLEAAKHEMQEFQRLQSGSSPPPVPEKQVSPHQLCSGRWDRFYPIGRRYFADRYPMSAVWNRSRRGPFSFSAYRP